MKPKLNLRHLFSVLLVVGGVSLITWQASVVRSRRAMLKRLTDNNCYWSVAELLDYVDRPVAIFPWARSPFGDIAVACIFLDHSPLEHRYQEIHELFPEAMMPVE